MSVYTPVGRAELAAWLEPLGCGELFEHAGIAAGIQNSNYFVTTDRGRYVLTVFETIAPASLDFYLALQSHLAQRGIPAPQPLADPAGRRWRPLAGKPAALLTCLPGASLEAAAPTHCRAVGELAFQAAQDFAALPGGVIHADLFRDNVLWDAGGRLSGVLDFYFAGVDAWLFDLAVAAGDWCADEAGLAALVDGYAAVRPPETAERQAWPALRRAAALRFWLSRLQARHEPRAGEVVTVKDPAHFRALLERFRLAPAAWPR